MKQLLRDPLPDAPVVSVQWDPSSGTVLAIAIRGYGMALWDTKGDSGLQMWSGMRYRNSLNKFSSSHREFDPLVQSWSAAGQLVVGMSDGSFAVWDSLTSQTFASQRSGRHKHGIKAASWLPSLFAPALALGSLSCIKVSQGFDSVEWSA